MGVCGAPPTHDRRSSLRRHRRRHDRRWRCWRRYADRDDVPRCLGWLAPSRAGLTARASSEALRETVARRARDADPLSAYVATILNIALVSAGQPLQAVEEGRRAVGLDPLSFVARWALGMALLDAGIVDEAEPVLEEAAAMSGRHPYALVTLARTCARKGEAARARELLRELESRAADGFVPGIQLAGTAEAAGERDAALAHARRALDEREPGSCCSRATGRSASSSGEIPDLLL
jgi:predicted Zn-dependent protease